MLIFGNEEVLEWRDFGYDRIIPHGLRTLGGLFEGLFLLLVAVKQAGAILGPSIGALAIKSSGVVNQEKDIENDVGRDDRLVKGYLDDFDEASLTRGYPVIVWRPIIMTISIPAFNPGDTLNLPKDGIYTPEAATTEYESCHTSSIRRYTKGVNNDEFRELIWQKGRELYRDMPWRQDTRPYYVLVSELMLQQTQVDRVIPKFNAFIMRFPDVATLAAASLAEVIILWQGLGYNRRAKYLHDAAKKIIADFNGVFPATKADLMSLPGVGPNTAGALLNYAFNQPTVFIETNVRTVYFHHYFFDGELVHDKQLAEVVAATLDHDYPREFYWALMDYGSWLKKQKVGRIQQSVHYKKQSALAGSVREVRGQILRVLAAGDMTLAQLQDAVTVDERFESALAGVIADGLVSQRDMILHLTK